MMSIFDLLFTTIKPKLPPSPAYSLIKRKNEMRNAMLSGGHSWEVTKAAIEEAYPTEYIQKAEDEYKRLLRELKR